MRKRIAAGLLAFALAFTAMDFGGLVSIQANAAGLVQVTEENQSNFHLNGDYAGYYAIADKEDLQAFAAKVNAGENAVNAVLTADIDMVKTGHRSEIQMTVIQEPLTETDIRSASWSASGQEINRYQACLHC